MGEGGMGEVRGLNEEILAKRGSKVRKDRQIL